MTSKKFIIIGGNLTNKGAQAMTFTIVDQIKRIYPESIIYLVSKADFLASSTKKEEYNFHIIYWSFARILTALYSPFLYRWIDRKRKSNIKLKEILLETDCFINISGYALSSEFYNNNYKNFIKSLRYIFSIILAKSLKKHYYILPQSVGPFNYPFPYNLILKKLFKIYLQYPRKIYIREMSGVKTIHPYAKKNLFFQRDIVLCGDKIESKNIFKKKFSFKKIKIEKNSVAIVPNRKVFTRMESELFFKIYREIIIELILMGKKIYILRHSVEDFLICNDIYSFFSHDVNVEFISENLNCLELEYIFAHLDYLVASRYHSLVYAFKSNVPAICIGWALKYQELFEFYSQEKILI
jgi:polysaccharide pyruvyl transferase WcaK-like protein